MVIYLGPSLPADSSGAFSRNVADGQPLPLGLAPNRGLPSQHLSILLVRSYRTFAPLPVPASRPSAVCFCGTLLTVTRTGRYPASLAIGEPGLSSIDGANITARCSIAITSPAFRLHHAASAPSPGVCVVYVWVPLLASVRAMLILSP